MTGLIVQEPEEDADDQCKDGQERDGAQRAAGNGQVALLVTAHGLVVRDDGAQAVNDGLHTQRSDERRNLQECDNAAVDGTEAGHDCHDDDEGHGPRNIGQPRQHAGRVVNALQQHGGEAGGQADLAAGGQVSALGNQASRNAAGDDETRGDVQQQVFAVCLGKEVLGRAADEEGQQNDQNNDRVIGQEFFKVEFFLHFRIPPYSNWVASVMMFSWFALSPSIKPVQRPSHMTMMRSDIPISSLISEEIMMMLLPCLAISAMMQ